MEIKQPIFKRIPPGDRWALTDDDVTNPSRIFSPLTNALEYFFQQHGARQFYIDAAEGIIYKVYTEEVPDVTPKFSIYGDY